MNNLKVEIIDTISNINKNKWNNLVEQSKLGSFFHRYEWLKAIEDEMGLEPRHIVVTKDEYPIGVFPNFIQHRFDSTPLIWSHTPNTYKIITFFYIPF